MNTSSQLNQLGYQNASPSVDPMLTDFQSQIDRSRAVNHKLNSIHIALVELIGRIYGEGVPICGESKSTPRPAGLCSELSESLSHIENVAIDLDTAIARLSRFA